MSFNQGRINKERRQLKSLARLVSKRTKNLDSAINKYVKTEDNKFYSVEEYRSLLNQFVESLREVIDKNTKIGESFKEVESDFRKVSEMASFTEHLDEIESMVD